MKRKRKRKQKVNCSVIECTKSAICKGMCGAHYAYYRRSIPEVKERLRNKRMTPDYNQKCLLRKHGLTKEQFDFMLVGQEGKCAICKLAPEGIGKIGKLYVDHCHNSNKVRGLLCNGCNSGIGQLRENIYSLRRAIAYIESWEELKPLVQSSFGKNIMLERKEYLKDLKKTTYYDSMFRQTHGVVRKYGITVAEYNQWAHDQSYLCMICDENINGDRKGECLHIDHCHESGWVRGLLCVRCNFGIGSFKENTHTMKSAIVYLSHHGVIEEELQPAF